MRRGFGALVLLLGSALVYEGSESRSSIGTGLGLLLVLAGSSMVLDLPTAGEGEPTPRAERSIVRNIQKSLK
jgi:hypothetical protein